MYPGLPDAKGDKDQRQSSDSTKNVRAGETRNEDWKLLKSYWNASESLFPDLLNRPTSLGNEGQSARSNVTQEVIHGCIFGQ